MQDADQLAFLWFYLIRKSLNYPWTTFKRLGLEELDIKNHFDYVFCLNVINHVKDIDRALDNLVNATKSGATLVLSIDVHRYNSLKKIFQFLPGDVLHPHQYNLTDYKAMLEKRDCHLLQSHCLKSGNIFDYWILVARCPWFTQNHHRHRGWA